jgi:hypothetical protein
MTTEPVGNAARGPAIPNNSHKARSETPKATPGPERVEPTKVVTGVVVEHKQPWYKRMARSMVADDATSVGDYILVDVLVPAIKNLIFDIITGGASRTLYGSARGIRRESSIRGGGPVSSIRSRYERLSEEPRTRSLTQEQRARHEFRLIELDDREEAVTVLESMLDYADRYSVVTVADFYTFCGVSGSHADRGWGWTPAALASADIRQYRRGWIIDLPEAVALR